MEVRRGRTRTERIKQPSCIAWFGAGQQVSNPATSTQQRVSLHPKGTKQATPKFGRNKRHHQYNGIFERSL